jgi:hypothetical protein
MKEPQMPDFSALLKRPAGEAKRPPELFAGDFYGLVKSYELGDNNTNKTPYVRLQVALQDWPDQSPDEWTVTDPEGSTTITVSKSDVDLSKRSMRRDFYLTDDALWRLDEFIRSCKIDPHGRPYEEVLPELVGQPVMVEVQQYLNQRTQQIGNQIGKLVGT